MDAAPLDQPDRHAALDRAGIERDRYQHFSRQGEFGLHSRERGVRMRAAAEPVDLAAYRKKVASA